MRAVHLRGLYKRMGRKPGSQGRTAGFGLGGDGSKDDAIDYLSTRSRFIALSSAQKLAFERFLMAFPTGTPPVVGWTSTVTSTNLAAEGSHLLLLWSFAQKGRCDLTVRGRLAGLPVSLVLDVTTGRFVWDRAMLSTVSLVDLTTALALKNSVLTFEGVPPGMGRRLAIDRDGDGILDGDEGVTAYGAASPTCAPALLLTANQSPAIGSPHFALVTRGGGARSPGLVLLSARRGPVQIVDLTIHVDLTAAILLQVGADARGTFVLRLPLPQQTRLVGTRLRAQTLTLAACGRLGLRASEGLELLMQR